MIEYIKQRRI